jgi:hypothetical protein
VAWTQWDGRQLVRATLAAALAIGLVCLVTAATDEGGVPWPERVGRAMPLTPLCAAFGVWGALAPVRSRGEVVALEALGRSPLQIAASSVAGGALVALAAALVVGLRLGAVDAAGFFPTATRGSAWAWDGGAFVVYAQGIRVTADGVPELGPHTGTEFSGAVLPYARASAAAATALAGVALPLLAARLVACDHSAVRPLPMLVAAAGTMAASVGCFQAAAAHRGPAWLAVLPPMALLAFAVRSARA